MGYMPMVSFIPLGLLATESQDTGDEWVNSWWSDGKAKWLDPKGWYDGANQQGSFLWCPFSRWRTLHWNSCVNASSSGLRLQRVC
jgi:hypothetical protein